MIIESKLIKDEIDKEIKENIGLAISIWKRYSQRCPKMADEYLGEVLLELVEVIRSWENHPNKTAYLRSHLKSKLYRTSIDSMSLVKRPEHLIIKDNKENKDGCIQCVNIDLTTLKKYTVNYYTDILDEIKKRVSPRDYQIILLWSQGETQADIAHEVGMSITGVLNSINRTRELVKKII